MRNYKVEIRNNQTGEVVPTTISGVDFDAAVVTMKAERGEHCSISRRIFDDGEKIEYRLTEDCSQHNIQKMTVIEYLGDGFYRTMTPMERKVKCFWTGLWAIDND